MPKYDFPVGAVVKNLPSNRGDMRWGFDPCVRTIPWKRKCTLAWEIPWIEEPGRLRLWGHKELDMTEQLYTHMYTHTYLGIELLGQLVTAWHLIISETVKLFSKVGGIFHSYQQCKRVPVFPHPCQHLLLSDFLISVILVGMKWHLVVLFDLHFPHD